MPKVPSVSPTTGKLTSPSFIHTLDGNFVDASGRTLLFRGVNLSGSTKAPAGQPSYIHSGFWEDAQAGGRSFVGQPLNLDDGTADVHLSRLRGWGFNILRYPITWEALEHEGPGKYDYEFMDYTIRVVKKCHEYGFKVFMDPHQDVWSRFSGGSGAPYWTLPACGFNGRNLTATNASVIHSEYPLPHESDPASLPAMIWQTNCGKLATQTLFTLFFAGRDFAPNCKLDGQNIQDYLQSHYIEAFGQLADRIATTAPELLDECIIGWDSMNEPSEGYIGCADLNLLPTEQGSVLKKGPTPTPAQSFRMGMGQTQTVEHWAFGTFGPHKDGTVTIDPQGLRAWAEPETEPGGVHPVYGWTRDPSWRLGTCVWAQHGVWDVETGYVMHPDYFHSLDRGEEEVAFIGEYWREHWIAYARRIRRAHPEAIHFVAPPVFSQPPPLDEEDLGGRCCYSTHYYDGLTLVSRKWNWFNADALGLIRGKYSSMLPAVRIGEAAIRKCLREQLAILKDDAQILGAYPTIIGEIGIPFDMDGRAAYYGPPGRRGDYTRQRRALDASLNACDGPNALNFALWTYCADSSHKWGDGWNMEDLSLWSADDMRPPSASMYTAASDKSSAMLLPHRRAMTAAQRALATPGSQLSLATTNAAPPMDTTSEPKFSQVPTYELLTDGARAPRAFSRPYPVRTVGVPVDLQFNVDTSDFKLVVRVRAQDATADKSLATEVFLPAVHYAADRSVGGVLLEQSADNEDPSAPSRASSSSETLPCGGAPPALELAVEFEVSSGRAEIDGTVLRWWYDAPAEGEEEREVTLVVKRRGGRIWTREDRGFERSVWDQARECLCGDACVMM